MVLQLTVAGIALCSLTFLEGCGGARQSGDRAQRLPTGMTFVSIPGGSFLMGSSDGNKDEMPVHTVQIEPFYLMTTEVTQRMWKELMWLNPSRFEGDDLPVEQVRWEEAQKFIQKLNTRYPGRDFRLPSEAEWEYACRAGSTTAFYLGDSEADLDSAGWYDDNSGSKSHPVGLKQPNAWGLYDMHGNVWEWCQDWFHDTYDGAPSDSSAWITGGSVYRVLRGGSWYSMATLCRSANRYKYKPNESYHSVGFRVAAAKG